MIAKTIVGFLVLITILAVVCGVCYGVGYFTAWMVDDPAIYDSVSIGLIGLAITGFFTILLILSYHIGSQIL